MSLFCRKYEQPRHCRALQGNNCGFVDEFHEFILAVNTKNPATAGLFKETQERGQHATDFSL
jgi:hypothetical protein